MGYYSPKMKKTTTSHPQVVPNLYKVICSSEHKRRYFEKCC